MLLKQRFQINRPFEEMELSLVRALVSKPELVNPTEEAVIRTALSLARIYRVKHGEKDVRVGAFLDPFRETVSRRLSPLLLRDRAPSREELLPLVRDLKDRSLRTRDELFKRCENRLPQEAIDRELRHKSLVLVSGGGGGTGYVYVGAMALLDEFGLRPKLMAGTSIGAILSLFRSRTHRFDAQELANIVRGLSWRRLFRLISTQNRYGLPAALRLYLRAGISRHFNPGGAEANGITLAELPVPTIVSVSGLRGDMLPHPVEFYERLLRVSPRTMLQPFALARRIQSAFGALSEFFTHPEMMVKLHLGADPFTRQFDALDAVGFSSALPGVIHYDVLRDDPRMHQMLGALMEEKGVLRLMDGGLADNLPARAAWRAVHKGMIGTRNVFILALNGFAPKLSTPLWLPLQRLAERTVAPNRPYAHLVKDFRSTLSPLELLPSVESLARATELGREQLSGELPFLLRMMAPLPRL